MVFKFSKLCKLNLITMSTIHRSKWEMGSSRGVIEPVQCIRLLPNASYVIECICFKKVSVIF